MTKRERVASILAEVFRQPVAADAEVSRAGTASWDSLNHLRVVMEVEEQFGVRFGPEDVAAVQSLEDLVRFVESRT